MNGFELMMNLLHPAKIEWILRHEWIGRIGCSSRGRTYVVPVSYVYDGTSIFGQTGTGMKVRMMRLNPSVCFEVDRSPTIKSWESVIVQGHYEELHDDAARAAVELLVERQRNLTTTAGMPPLGAGRIEMGSEETGPRADVVYRIVVEDRSGRYDSGEPLPGS